MKGKKKNCKLYHEKAKEFTLGAGRGKNRQLYQRGYNFHIRVTQAA
jgi:hypothetical protein